MKQTNCPNCGAPFDVMKIECPYCGTKYIDFTNLDLDSCDPVFIKMRVRQNGKSVVLLQRCIPTVANIEAHDDYYVDQSNLCDCSPFYIQRTPEISTNIEFRAIPMGDGSMYRIVVDK